MHDEPHRNGLKPPFRLLRIGQVIDMVGLRKSTLYARIQAGTFPKPARSVGVSLWDEREVTKWMEDVLASRYRASDSKGSRE